MDWKTAETLVDYPRAVETMEQRASEIAAGTAGELGWLLEHPPLYTAGTSAKAADLLDKSRFPVYETGRGGEYTYHGPGQRIAYLMLDLKKRHNGAPDLHRYVRDLERWIVAVLKHFGVEGFTREGRVGVWVNQGSEVGGQRSEERKNLRFPAPDLRPPTPGEAKIAALGIRVRKWVTLHGVSLNVNPDLSHYAGIVPCGVRGHGVTSLKELGINVSLEEADAALKKEFSQIFKI